MQRGSPPLTREQLPRQTFDFCSQGITPAHAGTTIACVCSIRRCRDHPRSRGNNSRSITRKADGSGSPPLTREQLRLSQCAAFAPRITPAHAGTTKLDAMETLVRKDHPRSRGNNFSVALAILSPVGSPPLTREQPCRCAHGQGRMRITPAHAGTTPQGVVFSIESWDHPRSRGNNLFQDIGADGVIGSPPLTREQLHEIHCVVSQLGITPAHAGTTDAAGFNGTGQWDHPRSRGNNHYPFTQIRFVLGSPPLTREQRTGK